jgi:hypothetical protein
MNLLRFSIIISLLSFSFVSLAKEAVPLLILSKDGEKANSVEMDVNNYSNFLNRFVKRSLKKRQAKLRSDDYELNMIVLGLSTDVRVGFLNWNISPSAAVEFHLKVLK